MSLADLMKKGSLRGFATVTVATAATVRPDSPPSVATVAPVSVATAQKQAANDPAAVTHDPDRWCWPHGTAMTGSEIGTFTARLQHLMGRGLFALDAERLANKLVMRDREADERSLCLECAHLAGHAVPGWSCRNWQQAGLATYSWGAQLSPALVQLLQRCDGFKEMQT